MIIKSSENQSIDSKETYNHILKCFRKMLGRKNSNFNNKVLFSKQFTIYAIKFLFLNYYELSEEDIINTLEIMNIDSNKVEQDELTFFKKEVLDTVCYSDVDNIIEYLFKLGIDCDYHDVDQLKKEFKIYSESYIQDYSANLIDFTPNDLTEYLISRGHSLKKIKQHDTRKNYQN